jgi:hypothetical protein
MAYRLDFDDAVNVWLRHFSGDYQYQIAASFPVNQGRINDVLKERLHPGSKQVALKKKSS